MTDKAKPHFGEPLNDWHLWFAWRPVRTWDGRWQWLKRVERRRIQLHAYLNPHAPTQWWQYQAL